MERERVYQAIYDKYIAPTKVVRKNYIGVELEMPVVNLSGNSVDEDTVHRIADLFSERFRFTPSGYDTQGCVTSFMNNDNGDILSFDCSYSNLELSFGKAKTLFEVYDRFKDYYSFLNERFNLHDHTLTGMGINPNVDAAYGRPIQNERYRMLYHYLHSYKEHISEFGISFHDRPDFGTFTSASQVQLDVGYDRLIDVINVNGLLEPYKAMLFANSYMPDHPQYLCVRNMLWEHSMQGYNPHNVGMFSLPIHSVNELVEYIGTQSIYCTMRDGKYIDFKPVRVSDYFDKDEIHGQYFDGEEYSKLTFKPQHSDIDYLRTFKFEDLTFRGTIEYRSSCCQPICDVMTVAAFHTGINERISELKELLENDKVIYSHGYSPTELQRMFSKRKYPDFVEKSELSDQLLRILELAKDGLKFRGYGEEKFLEPLYRRAEQLTNPAREMIDGIEKGVEMREFIEKYSVL
ncbi:MAG: glutamylcysteine synthetase [Clostridia bacterium]|nr:glutamylcysteine synthetase [Clostridia bacterium]